MVFWTRTCDELFAELRCGHDGLRSADADERLARSGPNSDAPAQLDSPLHAVLRRLLEPLSSPAWCR
jgi:Mg2+-importing ATPase